VTSVEIEVGTFRLVATVLPRLYVPINEEFFFKFVAMICN
jgi:hypothetical protein